MAYKAYFDRTDWRLQDDKRLIEAAHDSGHDLAIALGERLEDTTDGGQSVAELQSELDYAHTRIDALQAELDAAQDEIAALAAGPDA